MRLLNLFHDHQICRAVSGSFALQSIDSETFSFFHIVGWLKNLQIRLFTVAWHWVTLGVSVSAILDIHVKKISLKLLFLSDIFLFPFVRQQFPVLA